MGEDGAEPCSHNVSLFKPRVSVTTCLVCLVLLRELRKWGSVCRWRNFLIIDIEEIFNLLLEASLNLIRLELLGSSLSIGSMLLELAIFL
jgi:hypothetical protein